MRTKLRLLLCGLALTAAAHLAGASPVEARTFYWVSHGSPADPVWTYFLQGAKQWAQDTGNTVNTSFHSGDVPSHQEAIRAAIAAEADGIVSSNPDPGSLIQVVKEAHDAHIPIININTPDPTAGFDAYVGVDLISVGKRWAQYLVDKKLIKGGDFVWMPVEVPGATYGVQEEQVKAIVGLGDMVTGSIKRVFDQVGIKAGDIPVIGWGNSRDTTQEVLGGYVN